MPVMRKRRVGVTARSRQIVGDQGTGSPQVASEMAAPHELRTPMGTAAKAARVRMEVWRQWREVNRQNEIPRSKESARQGHGCRRGALRAHEALPHTPPGGKPPETPAPFPCCPIIPNGGNLSRIRKPRQPRASLTDPLRSEATTEIRERGPLCEGRLPLLSAQENRREIRTQKKA